MVKSFITEQPVRCVSTTRHTQEGLGTCLLDGLANLCRHTPIVNIWSSDTQGKSDNSTTVLPLAKKTPQSVNTHSVLAVHFLNVATWLAELRENMIFSQSVASLLCSCCWA